MHNLPHPGEVLRELCLKPLGQSVTEAAVSLGVSRKTLSSILDGRSGISPEMAIRLSIALGTTAESWLRQQLQSADPVGSGVAGGQVGDRDLDHAGGVALIYFLDQVGFDPRRALHG